MNLIYWEEQIVGSKLVVKLRNLMGDKVNIPTRLETPELKESEDEFKAETNRLMNDPRYKTDPSFQNMVAKDLLIDTATKINKRLYKLYLVYYK